MCVSDCHWCKPAFMYCLQARHALLYQGFTVHSYMGLIHLICGAKLLFQVVMYFQPWNTRSHQ